jgi:hypothetical protein
MIRIEIICGPREQQDFEIYEFLREYLSRSSGVMEPIVPLVLDADAHIDAEKTLDLPRYAALKEQINEACGIFCDFLLGLEGALA